jgi:hypothetical protein
MEWVLDHLQEIIAIAGAIAYWIMQNKKEGDQAGLPPGDEEKTFEDPELAERTRRIREEIQRRIEQRRGLPHHTPRAPEPEPAEPPPLLQHEPTLHDEAPPPVFRAPVPLEVPRPPEPTSARAPAVTAQAAAEAAATALKRREAEILEQQIALQEKLREIEVMRVAAQKRTEFEVQTGETEAPVLAGGRPGPMWRDDLRDPAGLRRAFVLREILGPPVANRD